MTVVGMWARGEVDLKPRNNPAKYSTAILLALDHIVTQEADRLGRRLNILDPFGGVGRAHRLGEAGHHVVTFELEPEWAAQAPGPSVVGDSRHLACRDDWADVVMSSPVYPNRMTDHHEARDLCGRCDGRKVVASDAGPFVTCGACKGAGLSMRNTYRHQLGRMPSKGATSVLQWGNAYRKVTAEIMAECLRPLRAAGLIVWNTSNHLRTVDRQGVKAQVEERVNEWFLNEWMVLGCNMVEVRRVQTQRNRNGANGAARVDGEIVAVMRAPSK